MECKNCPKNSELMPSTSSIIKTNRVSLILLIVWKISYKSIPLKEIFQAEDLVNHGIRDVTYSADGKAHNNGDLKMKNYDDTGIEPIPLGDKKLKKVSLIYSS